VAGDIGCVGIFVGISSFLSMSNFSKNNLLGLLFEFCHRNPRKSFIVYKRLEGLPFLLKLPLLASSKIPKRKRLVESVFEKFYELRNSLRGILVLHPLEVEQFFIGQHLAKSSASIALS